MAKMIPDSLSPDIKSNAEKHIFEWFKKAPGTEDWTVLHSLGISNHQRVIHGETDFLVLAPGLGIFALEVKGGRVRRELGKWYYINRYGDRDEKVRGPFDQAWEGIYSIRKSIEARLDKAHVQLKALVFGIGVMFPDIDYTSVGIDEEPWQVFDINDGNNVRNYIERIAKGAKETRKRLNYELTAEMYPTKADVDYLADLLRGDFDIHVPLKIKQKYTEEELLALTNEQAICIEQLADNARALIRGTAGTGKTLLALEAAKQAIADGEKVAFFCFNKLLGEWLQDLFSEAPINKHPMYVGSFHGYMINLLKSRGERFLGKKDNQFYNEVLPDMALKLLKDNPLKYDKIIVDEAQDLVTDRYLDVMDSSIRGGISQGKWIMFGDFSMQSIYASNMTELSYLNILQERASFALFRLTRNCRNTKKICLDIENTVGIPENAAFNDTIDTPSVDHITYTDIIDQKRKLEALLLKLRKKNISDGDIVILSPRKRNNSVVGMMEGFKIKDYTVQNSGRIRFSTIQAFKGLESSIVILTDIETYQDIKLIYVGLSRARFELHVFESESASSERNELFFQRRFTDGG